LFAVVRTSCDEDCLTCCVALEPLESGTGLLSVPVSVPGVPVTMFWARAQAQVQPRRQRPGACPHRYGLCQTLATQLEAHDRRLSDSRCYNYYCRLVPARNEPSESGESVVDILEDTEGRTVAVGNPVRRVFCRRPRVARHVDVQFAQVEAIREKGESRKGAMRMPESLGDGTNSQCDLEGHWPWRVFHPAFFFVSSFISKLSSGIAGYFSSNQSYRSSLTSPCTVISSPPAAVLVTLLPVANFLPSSLATFFKSSPCSSKPETTVTYFRLFRSTLLMSTMASAFLSASRCSAAAALAAFFAESFSARFWAITKLFTYLRNITSGVDQDDSSEAIPHISSPYPQTRNTVCPHVNSCQSTGIVDGIANLHISDILSDLTTTENIKIISSRTHSKPLPPQLELPVSRPFIGGRTTTLYTAAGRGAMCHGLCQPLSTTLLQSVTQSAQDKKQNEWRRARFLAVEVYRIIFPAVLDEQRPTLGRPVWIEHHPRGRCVGR
ncbi:hypothetical protein KCU88_g457, partial [Aureobasidium melanogenum]